MKIYVDAQAPFDGDGSKHRPFKTIQAAADIAMPGDKVRVFPGIYRENVNPKHAGTADQRIAYEAVEPLKAIITGAEVVKGWEKTADGIWQVKIPNSMFSERNPYTVSYTHLTLPTILLV